MWRIVGACPRCGAPIYAFGAWASYGPPQSYRSCGCFPAAMPSCLPQQPVYPQQYQTLPPYAANGQPLVYPEPQEPAPGGELWPPWDESEPAAEMPPAFPETAAPAPASAPAEQAQPVGAQDAAAPAGEEVAKPAPARPKKAKKGEEP